MDFTKFTTEQLDIAAEAFAKIHYILGARECMMAAIETLPEEDDSDSVRLDWLVNNSGYRVLGSVKNGWSVADCNNGLTFISRSLLTYRQAIDEAIKKVSK